MNKIIPTLALVAGFSLNVSAATVDLIEGSPISVTVLGVTTPGEAITNPSSTTVTDPDPLALGAQVAQSGNVAVAQGTGPAGAPATSIANPPLLEDWYLNVSGGIVTTTVSFGSAGLGAIAPDIKIYATNGSGASTGPALADVTASSGQTSVSVSDYLSASTNPYIIEVSGPLLSGYNITVATPIPAATWLFGSAFVGLMTYYRRKVGAFGSFNGLAA